MAEIRSTPHVYQHLVGELTTHVAEVYVRIGDDRDDVLRCLFAFDGPDRDYAFVFIGVKQSSVYRPTSRPANSSSYRCCQDALVHV